MLNWLGDEVIRNTHAAARIGIDETTAACVRGAKGRVPRKTTALHGSIQMRPAVSRGNDVVGTWGSFQILYALYVELGTDPHEIRPKAKKALYWPGAAHPVKVVHHPGTRAQPYLVPTAEDEYPKLAGRIRSHL